MNGMESYGIFGYALLGMANSVKMGDEGDLVSRPRRFLFGGAYKREITTDLGQLTLLSLPYTQTTLSRCTTTNC